MKVAPSHLHTSPWITPEQAAEWAGVSVDDIEGAGVRLIRLSRNAVRVPEREVGQAFGLELPGPREQQLIADWQRRQDEKKTAKPKRPKVATDHWLYWLYDDADRLLYVGITNSGVKRMEQHGAEKIWWPKVAIIKVDHYATREEAEIAEREAIRAQLPIYNGTHSVRFRKGRLFS